MSPHARGALVVIEGLDRAGKSTQCELLCQNFERQSLAVRRMRFPDRSTSIGSSINNYLKGESQQEDHVIHLLFSANRWEAASRIRENIARGVSVIIDRYYYSGIVYSAAKNRKDLSLEWSRQPEIGLPRPDLCIFLDISPEEAAQRGGFGTERYETDEMQKKVRQLFYELRERVEHEEMVFVDAGASIKEVEQIMIGLATKLLKSKILDEPLRSLH